ncbi:MAG TPA: sugar ABC transporter permease [Acidimicrobiales bacterium]|nr:sugar ABC transporter permease [Acidimicrobiales bacterium]
MGPFISAVLAVAVAVAGFIAVFTLLNLAVSRLPGKWEQRVRPWVFVGPALIFLFIGLFMPAIRTIYLSFRGGNRGQDGFTVDNYVGTGSPKGVFRDKSVVSFDNFDHIFTSRLFIVGVVIALLAGYLGWRSAHKSEGGRGIEFSNPSTSVGLVIAVILVLFAVFTVLRGVLWNNLWWVVAVTGLATVFGLGLAVLADRSRKETLAKTMIFMPMAISLVGAAVIWSFVYNIKAAGQAPGLLNAILDLFGIKQIDFLRSADIIPWNNFFIMIIMIWIQTGFALVVLSAAVKAVPMELIEAAKVDGANDIQVFWRITLPEIIPTVLVVVTTLIVTVMKIFDIVKATTNGAFGTDVLANRMYTNLRDGNFTMSSTFSVIILVLVAPVIWWNFRRNRQEARV